MQTLGLLQTYQIRIRILTRSLGEQTANEMLACAIQKRWSSNFSFLDYHLRDLSYN